MDEDDFIHSQTVTPGNAHDCTERDTLLLSDEAALYADAAYCSQATREKLEQFVIDDQVQRKGYRGHPLSKADLVRNKEIAVIRSGGERPFAIYKSRYGFARTRLMGLAKNLTLFGWQPSPIISRRGQSSRRTTACQTRNPLDKCDQNQKITPETQHYSSLRA